MNKTTEEIRTILSKIGLDEMKTRVAKTFFNMENVVETLYRAFVSGKNVILYGPGGFGKTTVVQEFIKQAELNHSVIIGYEDMDVEGLLGIPNIEKLMKESTYEISFDKTVFVNPGILILEEFLDVNPKTAIALKDIITSGGYRHGNKFIESRIGSIVICSNRSPYELSIDNSTTAFYRERFPIVLNVEWVNYSAAKYLNFIIKIIDEKEFSAHEELFRILSELAYRTGKLATGPVSPRIIKDTIEFLRYNEYNIDNLRFIDGLNTSILKEVRSNINLNTEVEKITTITLKVNTKLKDFLNKSPITARHLMDSILEIKKIIEKLKSLEVQHTDSMSIIKKCILKCEDTYQILWDKITPDHIDVDNIFEL